MIDVAEINRQLDEITIREDEPTPPGMKRQSILEVYNRKDRRALKKWWNSEEAYKAGRTIAADSPPDLELEYFLSPADECLYCQRVGPHRTYFLERKQDGMIALMCSDLDRFPYAKKA